MSKRNKSVNSSNGKRKLRALNPEKKPRKGECSSKRQIEFSSDENEPSSSTSIKEIREQMENDGKTPAPNLSVII